MNKQRLTVSDLDAHLRWKQAPIPAEACSELGADDNDPTPTQWRLLIAICVGAWLIPILAMTIAAGVAS